jgi:hypothetical protein
MLRKVFLDHPRQVGESYGEHLIVAAGFGAAMVRGGIACMAHAVIPAVFPTTGSDTVRRLYDQMVRKRAAKRDAYLDARVLDWVI